MAGQISTCPIWGSEFEAKGFHIPQTKTNRVDDSPRAGGGYEIDQVLIYSHVNSMSEEEKARLTTWLVDQRMPGGPPPRVTEEIISHAKNKLPLPVHVRAERLLKFMTSSARTVANRVVCSEGSDESHGALAWSESTIWPDVVYFLNYLETMGWIQKVYGNVAIEEMANVTVSGYNRIAEQYTNVDSSQAFVAMWFDPQMDEAYKLGILPAIEEAGYKPLRIDHKLDVNKIDDEIIAEIRRSRFLVADFTQGDDGARGGVYYEAGFALGLGLDFIYTCRNDKVGKLAFDTRQYNHILWETPQDLRAQLRNRIEARIGKGPIAP